MQLDTIYNMDCLEGLKQLEDNSVDLLITDPPYLLTGGSGGGAFGRDKQKFYKELDNISNGFDMAVLDECCRVLKKINAYVWCSKEQVRLLLNYFYDKGCNLDILTWHKTNPMPACCNKYLSDTEYLVFAREKGVKIYGTFETKRKHWETPMNVKDKKLWNHPTIKPLDIIETLVTNSSEVGGGNT